MWPGEWDACSWSLQQTYLDGLAAEGLITMGEVPAQPDEESPFSHRTADTGAQVIDLQQMIRESQGA
jgi:hypothetical protein